MFGTIDVVLFGTGFVVGAGCVVMLGVSLLEDYAKRVVVAPTIVGASIAGLITGWCFNYFFHFAQR